MSREVSAAEQVLKAVLGTAFGVGLTVATTVTALLLTEHLKRKMDKGLVHWPFRPGATIWLGGVPPEWAARPPNLRPVPAPPPAPGPRVNLGGLLPLESEPQ